MLCVFLLFFLNIYSRLPTFSLVSEARTISVHSSLPASCPIHHSLPFTGLLQRQKSFTDISYKQTKVKPLSILKFLWRPHSLAFPQGKKTGEHHLKILFLSFFPLLPSILFFFFFLVMPPAFGSSQAGDPGIEPSLQL